MESYNKKLKPNSRTLRTNMTDAEQKLWHRLRRKQLQGLQFYRQKPLLTFIVDFYCPVAKLVIELDGSQHFEVAHQTKDQGRDAAFASMGLLVLRFDNRQVLTETEAVMEMINRVVNERLNPP
jgi:very-short-patch-repair endonuclease